MRVGVSDNSSGLGPIPGESGRLIAARRGTISLVVVDAHAPVREGLPLLLAPVGVQVVATAATGDGGEAVIGGTGAYAGAHGTITSAEGPKASVDTVTLLP